MGLAKPTHHPATKRKANMPHKRNYGQFGKPRYNQAQKVVARFGGEAKLAKLIGLSRITVYRWQYIRPYGSDGLIPTAHIEKIKAVARLEGVLIRSEDWVPETNVWPTDGEPQTPTRKRPSLSELLA